jgi:hypothetical protein
VSDAVYVKSKNEQRDCSSETQRPERLGAR